MLTGCATNFSNTKDVHAIAPAAENLMYLFVEDDPLAKAAIDGNIATLRSLYQSASEVIDGETTIAEAFADESLIYNFNHSADVFNKIRNIILLYSAKNQKAIPEALLQFESHAVKAFKEVGNAINSSSRSKLAIDYLDLIKLILEVRMLKTISIDAMDLNCRKVTCTS